MRDVDVFDLEIAGESLVVISMPVADTSSAGAGLTVAERQVAHDVLAGLSNAEIARRRGRSPRTIANQLGSIYRKLRVSSRAEMTARLLADGA
jgi:DNA-binding CsgD family transcriptional regulator